MESEPAGGSHLCGPVHPCFLFGKLPGKDRPGSVPVGDSWVISLITVSPNDAVLKNETPSVFLSMGI